MPPSLRHSVDLRSTPIYRLLPQADNTRLSTQRTVANTYAQPAGRCWSTTRAGASDPRGGHAYLHAARAGRPVVAGSVRASSSPTSTSTASITSSPRCSARPICATSTTSRCSPTTRRGSRRGVTALEAFLARRRLSLHPAKTHVVATAAPATFPSASSCGRPGAVDCRRRTCGGFATGFAGPATAGGRVRSRGGRWSSGWARLGGARGAR